MLQSNGQYLATQTSKQYLMQLNALDLLVYCTEMLLNICTWLLFFFFWCTNNLQMSMFSFWFSDPSGCLNGPQYWHNNKINGLLHSPCSEQVFLFSKRQLYCDYEILVFIFLGVTLLSMSVLTPSYTLNWRMEYLPAHVSHTHWGYMYSMRCVTVRIQMKAHKVLEVIKSASQLLLSESVNALEVLWVRLLFSYPFATLLFWFTLTTLI